MCLSPRECSDRGIDDADYTGVSKYKAILDLLQECVSPPGSVQIEEASVKALVPLDLVPAAFSYQG